MIQGWVFVPPSCAHMQRLYDNLEYLKKPAFSHVPVDPQIIGAIGAAVFARRNGQV
jgi:activator of 2-hydroxyglutaryl-CoA dehydratase